VEPFDSGDGVLAVFLDDADARNGRESSLGCGAQLTRLWAGGDSYENGAGLAINSSMGMPTPLRYT